LAKKKNDGLLCFFFLIFNNNGATKIGTGLGNLTLGAGPGTYLSNVETTNLKYLFRIKKKKS
jgi:hypothetical protein